MSSDLVRLLMANNRMYLVNKKSKARIYLAKYYPSLGWYSNDEKLFEHLNEEFHKSDWSHLTPEQNRAKAAATRLRKTVCKLRPKASELWRRMEIEYEERSEPNDPRSSHGANNQNHENSKILELHRRNRRCRSHPGWFDRTGSGTDL